MTTLAPIERRERATISRAELEQLEGVVREGLQAFMAVGLALIEIRETRGYLLRNYANFADYCTGEFGFSARHGRRMMEAARTSREVARHLGQGLRNYHAARALKPVAKDPLALKQVKARLARRGQRLERAPGSVVGAVVRDVLGLAPVAVSLSSLRAGQCPHCGEIPRAYRRVEHIWQCGFCGEEVALQVKVSPES